jgi:hypothetical protein
MATVRAKFKVAKLTRYGWGQGEHEEVTLSPVYPSDESPENKQFWEATPNGEIRLYIQNPGAIGKFPLGREFYVDFTPADS